MPDQVTVSQVLNGAGSRPSEQAKPSSEPVQMSGGGGSEVKVQNGEGLGQGPVLGGTTAGEKQPKAERFARLAQREKALQSKRNELQAKEMELERRARDAEEKVKAFEATRANALKDPDGYLQAGGLSYDDLVNFKLKGAPTEGMTQRELDRRLAEFEAKQAAEREARAKEEHRTLQAREQAVIQEYEASLVQFVRSQPEKYELTNLQKQESLLPEVVREYHRRHGKLLSAEEAADLVESHLEEQAELAVKQSKRLSQKYAARETKQPEEKSKSVTLTNHQTTSSAPKKPLSDEERFRRAMAVETKR